MPFRPYLLFAFNGRWFKTGRLLVLHHYVARADVGGDICCLVYAVTLPARSCAAFFGGYSPVAAAAYLLRAVGSCHTLTTLPALHPALLLLPLPAPLPLNLMPLSFFHTFTTATVAAVYRRLSFTVLHAADCLCSVVGFLRVEWCAELVILRSIRRTTFVSAFTLCNKALPSSCIARACLLHYIMFLNVLSVVLRRTAYYFRACNGSWLVVWTLPPRCLCVYNAALRTRCRASCLPPF